MSTDAMAGAKEAIGCYIAALCLVVFMVGLFIGFVIWFNYVG